MKITHPIAVCVLLSGAVHAAAFVLTPPSRSPQLELSQAATSLQVTLTTSNAARPAQARAPASKPAQSKSVKSTRQPSRQASPKSKMALTTLATPSASQSTTTRTVAARQTEIITENTPTVTDPSPFQRTVLNSSANSAASLAQRRNLISKRLQHELATYFRYPYTARRRGWQGRVVLGVWITPSGRIDHVAVQKSSGHVVLDEAALTAMHRVSKLDWAPALLRGETLEIELPVIYRLMGG